MNCERFVASANTALTAFSMAVLYCSTPRSDVTTMAAPMLAKFAVPAVGVELVDVDVVAEHVLDGVPELGSRQATQQPRRRGVRRRVRVDCSHVDDFSRTTRAPSRAGARPGAARRATATARRATAARYRFRRLPRECSRPDRISGAGPMAARTRRHQRKRADDCDLASLTTRMRGFFILFSGSASRRQGPSTAVRHGRNQY